MPSIEFIPASEEIELLIEPPSPSKFSIPQWFKDKPKFDTSSEIIFNNEGSVINKELKMCMPFIDAMTGGYIQRTWCDIHIKKVPEGGVKYHWAHSPKPLGDRGGCNVPISNKYYPLEFHWINPWTPKLPEGYSLLITHPLNRLDLPFTTMSGIIDSDKFFHVDSGQYPFYIDHDFEGVIPCGTPMYQMIPIKREKWGSEKIKYDEKDKKKRSYISLKEFWNVYRNYFWQKKKYD